MKKLSPARTLGPAIKKQRNIKGMTRLEFAEALSALWNQPISESVIYNWETGRTYIIADLLTDICSTLNCCVLDVVPHSTATTDLQFQLFETLRSADEEIIDSLAYLFYKWNGNIHELLDFVVLHAAQDEKHREVNNRTVLQSYDNCSKEGNLDKSAAVDPLFCEQVLKRMHRRVKMAEQGNNLSKDVSSAQEDEN